MRAVSSICIIALFLLCLPASDGIAAKGMETWNRLCVSCHNGTTAPDAAALAKKYGSVEEFVSSVKAKGAQCMNIVKNDERTIRKIGREIGIPVKKSQ